MKRFRAVLLGFYIVILSGVMSTTTVAPIAMAVDPASSSPTDCSPAPKFLGIIPTWYEYLERDPTNDCHPKIDFENDPAGVWKIGAAVVEILLRIGGILIVFWVLITGFQYIISNGNPDANKNVRNRLIYGGVGLAIIIFGSGLVSFVARRLTGE